MEKSNLKVGDLALTIFPFTDLSSDKVRPAVVIGNFQDDVTVLYITKQNKQRKYGIILEPQKENGLKYKSSVIVSKIATLDKKTVLGKIGSLNGKEFGRVKLALKDYLNL